MNQRKNLFCIVWGKQTNIDHRTVRILRVDLFRNPILNKSFDVLPQVKDPETPSADPDLQVSRSALICRSDRSVDAESSNECSRHHCGIAEQSSTRKSQ